MKVYKVFKLNDIICLKLIDKKLLKTKLKEMKNLIDNKDKQ